MAGSLCRACGLQDEVCDCLEEAVSKGFRMPWLLAALEEKRKRMTDDDDNRQSWERPAKLSRLADDRPATLAFAKGEAVMEEDPFGPVPQLVVEPLTRESCLAKARSAITGERNAAYGSPEDNFSTIAAMWTAYANRRGIKCEFGSADVAAMMILVKVARIANTIDHGDSYVDICGYSACGAEAARAK